MSDNDRKKPSDAEKHRTRGQRGGRWIFRPVRVDPRTGKVYVAAHYGRKAWPIWVPDDESADDARDEPGEA